MDVRTVHTQADEKKYDEKLERITEWNEFIVDTEEDDSPQNTRTRNGNRKRKGITIHEEANTVRGIPKDNQGKTKGKRYSEEPSWLTDT